MGVKKKTSLNFCSSDIDRAGGGNGKKEREAPGGRDNKKEGGEE